MHKRIVAAFTGVLICVGLAGCFETFERPDVYFENNTDQELLLVARAAEGKTREPLPPHTTTGVSMLQKDTCGSDWLIVDSTGTTVVKDPGEICWHQTVTIP
nr:hypothetical protein [Propionicimonas sp.]